MWAFRLGSIDDAEQLWKRAVNKVQASQAFKGGALEELEEGDDEGPQPVLEMDFTIVDMGMHFVEVDQTPLEEDQARNVAASPVPRSTVRWLSLNSSKSKVPRNHLAVLGGSVQHAGLPTVASLRSGRHPRGLVVSPTALDLVFAPCFENMFERGTGRTSEQRQSSERVCTLERTQRSHLHSVTGSGCYARWCDRRCHPGPRQSVRAYAGGLHGRWWVV